MARIVVGVTGGIAAFKSIEVIRQFSELGHDVRVVPTNNALRFVGKATLEAVSHNPVDEDLFSDVADVKHVALAAWAELIVVAPATASFLARTVAGVADDLLGNTILAANVPTLIAPAMHTNMWLNVATVENTRTLKERGYTVLEPAVGRLTGGDSGVGRLPEPSEIVSNALHLLKSADLSGMRFLITAGGTQEPIDPVRFIGNRSSGKQGLAIAREATRRGAQVHFVAANINTQLDEFAQVTRVQDASALQSVVLSSLSECDVLVMAAAVSDFRVELPATTKIKKTDPSDVLSLNLVQNPDVLATAVSLSREKGLAVFAVGFAAETAANEADLLRLAQSKMLAKGCKVIVANDVSDGNVFDSDANTTLMLTESGRVVGATGSKTAVANQLLDLIVSERAT